MKNLINYLKALWGAWGNLQSKDVRHDCRLTVGSPSGITANWMLKLLSVLVLVLTIGIGKVWADYTVTFKTVSTEETSAPTINKTNLISSGGNYVNTITGSYIMRSTSTNGLKFGSNKYAGNIELTMTNTGTYIGQIQASAIKFTGAKKTNGDLKYTITYTDDKTPTSSTQSLTTTATDYTIKLDSTKTVKSVKIENTSTKKQFYVKGFTILVGYTITFNCDGASSGCPTTISHTRFIPNPLPSAPTKAGYTFEGWYTNEGCTTEAVAGAAINANTTLYAKWEADASCEANPTIGAASLNGPFNMTSTTSSIGVSSGTCSTGNAACDWTDYGFVWSDGANTTTPTVGGTNCNKVKVGESGTGTSWTGSITPSGSTTPTSWTTGHTYYVRTYGKNSKAGAAFVEGSTWSFTPYMVTFNKNDGGATTSTQYVQGGVSTLLTSNSFSRTGYTFNGWNTDADGTSGTGYTNGQSVSLSANLTLYAKWSAKQCTISFDIEGGTGTITNVTATYGQAMPSKESNLPTKTGYNFGGFWDGDGGTGTQYYNADGTSKINWNKDVTATQTLYAKWTLKSYSVTWMVNGSEWSEKGGSANVNHGSHVSTLPTAPNPAEDEDACGDKFVGWTTVEEYKHGTSPLFTTADDAPVVTVEGDVTYYAVFADYDD